MIHDSSTTLLKEHGHYGELMGAGQHVVSEWKPSCTLRNKGELWETEQDFLTSTL